MAFTPRSVYELGDPDDLALRDWPAALRLSAARERLAQALYAARGDAYVAQQPGWQDLRSDDRRHYRAVALQMLAAVKP